MRSQHLAAARLLQTPRFSAVERGLSPSHSPRGAALVLAVVMLVVILGVVALVVDLGYLYISYAQLQTCADAGSLAGAEELLNDGLVRAVPNYAAGQAAARAAAVQFASANKVGTNCPAVDSNITNSPSGDVVIGYMADPTDPSVQLDFTNPAQYNAVQVRVRKTADMNGLVPAFFSRIWGNRGESLAARSTAVVSSSIAGFQVTEPTRNTGLMPFAVNATSWNALVAGIGLDNYAMASDSNAVGGSDGILELNLFPLSNGTGGLVPGNFGTVDIGSPNNSTADLKRQILYGVNSDDLSYLGGALMLGADGTLELNGDTGVSAGIENELERIKGQPRTFLVYSTVTGQGNNATYTIVGFVGARIMDVRLTGPMSRKRVVIQPAIVVDDTSVVDYTRPNESMYVYSNVRLAR